MNHDGLFKPTFMERILEFFNPKRKEDRVGRARRHMNSLIERYDRAPARERKNR
jgi:hypothetical protein